MHDYSGTKAHRVELAVTEHNSVFSNPGKQTASLVNGLFYADAVGNLLKTEFNAMLWWDLRNGQEARQQQQLHAVRLASLRRLRHRERRRSRRACRPVSDVLCNKLLKYFARGFETVVQASSDYRGLGVYAVRGTDNRGASWSSTSILAVLNATISVPHSKGGETAKGIQLRNSAVRAARTAKVPPMFSSRRSR